MMGPDLRRAIAYVRNLRPYHALARAERTSPQGESEVPVAGSMRTVFDNQIFRPGYTCCARCWQPFTDEVMSLPIQVRPVLIAVIYHRACLSESEIARVDVRYLRGDPDLRDGVLAQAPIVEGVIGIGDGQDVVQLPAIDQAPEESPTGGREDLEPEPGLHDAIQPRLGSPAQIEERP